MSFCPAAFYQQCRTPGWGDPALHAPSQGPEGTDTHLQCRGGTQRKEFQRISTKSRQVLWWSWYVADGVSCGPRRDPAEETHLLSYLIESVGFNQLRPDWTNKQQRVSLWSRSQSLAKIIQKRITAHADADVSIDQCPALWAFTTYINHTPAICQLYMAHVSTTPTIPHNICNLINFKHVN